MHSIVYIIFILILFLIFFQDFKAREISWWTLPLVLLSSLFMEQREMGVVLSDTLINVAFIGINLLAITIYFSIKEGKLINIIDRQLGLGDVLFFIVCCFIFSVPNFILFFLLSMITSVLVAIVIKLQVKQSSIPLAGVMAFLLVGISLLNFCTPFNVIKDSEWVNSWLL